ncbi:unnamed protein product [Dibothriocephalus latus]|uniref:GIY-YIG domain-containing protein n=1 Tax=Dibothriocephalus latus TaxID=60516 RepID=A0A3P7R0I7_DIBLA|nr:unnamed protein product [Dibothriocephalus latus]
MAYKIRCNVGSCKYVGEIVRKLQARLHEHEEAARRRGPNLQLTTHIGGTGNNFDIQEATIVGRETSKKEILTLEAWYSEVNTVNRHLAFPVAYKILRHYVSKEKDKVKVNLGFAKEDGSVTKPPEGGAGLSVSSTVWTKHNTNCRQAMPKYARRVKQRTEKNRPVCSGLVFLSQALLTCSACLALMSTSPCAP